MEDHQERDSNEDLLPDLADESKVALAEVHDEYEVFMKSGERAAADTLVAGITGTQFITAGHRYMATLRMRKAARAKGFQIGV